MIFQEVIPYVKDEKKYEFENFIIDCKFIYDKYKLSDVIKYIQKNYKEEIKLSGDFSYTIYKKK